MVQKYSEKATSPKKRKQKRTQTVVSLSPVTIRQYTPQHGPYRRRDVVNSYLLHHAIELDEVTLSNGLCQGQVGLQSHSEALLVEHRALGDFSQEQLNGCQRMGWNHESRERARAQLGYCIS